ncbi:MAG: acetyl-CoA carboxylase carboxyltransferase subunit alpha [Pyrinomonadaceae bacterium]|nr:acetyl-CoA carboxylase carboxyltransferase subunit alpha [Pyrinomonadaceae bacterium]MCX7640992.1 acetyl-CoA carboxylase carboxyltransferase subunit alpha [Pyrinomonadaceae bacterium]MDW8305084.1 acetyl-CoA carboxylase carboxyltransferase subunit alpha [Acidobacteriota bacterium]
MSDKTAFDRVQLARHPDRPYTLDLIGKIFDDFVELHGDRRFSDDAAIVAGFASIEKMQVAVVGHQKGRDMQSRKARNFGMPKPEGYRKALRVMKIAEKFSRPVITFVDTPGAYPGIDAEERGQAEAIAYNLREMARLRTPVIVVVIGEGGSGGALAIGVGDRILMMENAIYSVISPEGCAAILWKDASFAPKAAQALRLTAKDLFEFGVVDEVVPEDDGWFVSDETTSSLLKRSILKHLSDLCLLSTEELLRLRYEKFRKMGLFFEASF